MQRVHFRAHARKKRRHLFYMWLLIFLGAVQAILYSPLVDWSKSPYVTVAGCAFGITTTFLASWVLAVRLEKLVEGHRVVATRYRSVAGRIDRVLRNLDDGRLTEDEFVKQADDLETDYDELSAYADNEAFTPDEDLANWESEQTAPPAAGSAPALAASPSAPASATVSAASPVHSSRAPSAAGAVVSPSVTTSSPSGSSSSPPTPASHVPTQP